MKKILLILLACVGFMTTQAQSSVKVTPAAGDTIVNSATVTRILPQLTGGYAGAIVQVDLTRIGGTLSGSITLSGSLNGVLYTAIGSAYSFSNTNLSAYFSVAAPLPQYLKITSVGTGGAMSATQAIWYKLPKYQDQH